jgi:UDP-N-acetylmuramate dehydrogenase
MTTAQLHQLLTTQFSDLTWQLGVELGPLTYMKIGGPAEIFLDIDDIGRIAEVVTFLRQHEIQFRILAGASNVIVPSEGLPGVTIRITNENYCKLEEKNTRRPAISSSLSGV